MGALDASVLSSILSTLTKYKKCSIIKPMPYKDKNSPEALESLRRARRKYYHSHKETEKARNSSSRRVIKEYIREAKNVPCTDCKLSYPYYVMDFDHLQDKVFTISKLASWKSLELVKTEIAKCEVVCSNCHRVRSFRRKQHLAL